MTALSRITPEQMADYLAHKLTSTQLSELTGYAAPYIRRSIKRDPKPVSQDRAWREERSRLVKARRAYQASIAHLSAAEIMEQAKVSQATAFRIKQRHGKKAAKP